MKFFEEDLEEDFNKMLFSSYLCKGYYRRCTCRILEESFLKLLELSNPFLVKVHIGEVISRCNKNDSTTTALPAA